MCWQISLEYVIHEWKRNHQEIMKWDCDSHSCKTTFVLGSGKAPVSIINRIIMFCTVRF